MRDTPFIRDSLDAALQPIVERELLQSRIDADRNGMVTDSRETETASEDDTTSDVLMFPDVAWRGAFQTYREAMDGTTEASDVYHFASLWAAVAVRLRRKVYFSYGINLYPNVYLCVYGPTGDRKTTATRRSLSLLESESVKSLQGGGSGEGLADWLKTEGVSLISHYLLALLQK